MYPIFDNRTVIGQAKTVSAAKRVLASLVSVPRGFHLHVWLRSDVMCEILEQPQGFVFSVSNSVKN